MGTSGNGTGALLDLRATRAALAGASGKDKLDLLLSAPDPRALVRSLPEQELYLAILDIGLDDSAELVAMASPRQFVHFLDAACWPRRDAPPDPRKILKWMTLARKGADATDLTLRRYYEKLSAVDPELFSLLLRFELVVHEIEENEPLPEVASGNSWTSPDRRYLVEIKEDGAGYAVLKRLLDDLAAQDAFMVSRTLEAIRWDVPTELEETARRWREGRLRDLGVPGIEEALGFVARPPRSKAAKAAAAGSPQAAAAPGAPAAPAQGAAGPVSGTTTSISGTTTSLALAGAIDPPMLDRAIARLSGDDLDFAEEAVAYAANASLVAWSVQLDDAPEVHRVLTDAHSLLSLGLELVSNGDVVEAAGALAGRPVRQIFQAAMAELYRLQSRARVAARSLRLPQAQSVTLLEPPHSLLIDALARTPPSLAGLDIERPMFGPRTPGAGRQQTSSAHAPATRAEVARADALLEEAEALALLLSGLGLRLDVVQAAADQASLAPSALRAADVLRARALCDLGGVPFTLVGLPDRGEPLPAGLADKLDALLDQGAKAVEVPDLVSAAQRIRGVLRARILGG
jgi:Family of unknown function (DUF6178)